MARFDSTLNAYLPTLKRYLPTLLIVVGLLLLVYVGTQYGQMYAEQRNLEKEWERQQARVLEGGPKANEIVEQGLTRISIPKIDLSAMVVEGTDRKSLNLGPGHLKGTSLPGAEGNSVVTAHRDSFFRHLVELAKGDQILVQRSGRTYTYEVASRKIVKPHDVSVIQPTKENRLTLITCYPTYYIGPAPERLIVTAKLVGEPDPNVKVASNAPKSGTLPGDESKAATASK